jgi:hypothetical protein
MLDELGLLFVSVELRQVAVGQPDERTAVVHGKLLALSEQSETGGILCHRPAVAELEWPVSQLDRSGLSSLARPAWQSRVCAERGGLGDRSGGVTASPSVPARPGGVPGRVI